MHLIVCADIRNISTSIWIHAVAVQNETICLIYILTTAFSFPSLSLLFPSCEYAACDFRTDNHKCCADL